MPIKARYDPKEDRMLLIMEPAEGEKRVFWVTRRQWLGLYNGLGPLKPEKEEVKPPPQKPQPLPESLTSVAKSLDGIKMNKKEDGFQVAFVAEGKPMGLQLKGDSLEQMKRMLDQQADRAGWDVQAALERMKAAMAANAAVKKASNKG